MKIAFLLTDKDYSGEFLASFLATFVEVGKQGHQLSIRHSYSPFPHFSFQGALGGLTGAGADQKPFQGKQEFDLAIMVGSNMRFTPQQVLSLIESPHDVTCGYFTVDGKQTLCLKSLENVGSEDSSFVEVSEIARKEDDAEDTEKYMPMEFSSASFMAIRSGVFDKITYPWWFDGSYSHELPTHELSFCRKLAAAGVKVHIDRDLRVGHISEVVL